MIKLRIKFHLEADDRFIITAERPPAGRGESPLVSKIVYDHEDAFLQRIISADLDPGTTQDLVIAVLLSVAKSKNAGAWIPLVMTSEQSSILGFGLSTNLPSNFNQDLDLSLSFLQNTVDFQNFLMNAPTPFAVLSGPDQILSFMNEPYARLLGRFSGDQLLGLPARVALPDPGFQLCLGLLEKAYRTGEAQVRRELLNTFQQQDTGLLVEAYFDIVYHPVRNAAGNVIHILAQATDVTERVLARHVSDDREQKLYRLWAELEAIYSVAPVGIAVIDATNLRLLRLNNLQAGFLGDSRENLENSLPNEPPTASPEIIRLVKLAATGETRTNVILERLSSSAESGGPYSVSVRPSLNPVGVVETVTLTTLDLGVIRIPPYSLSAETIQTH